MIEQAWAGHAGETGIAALMPHELLGVIVLLIGLVVLLAGLSGYCLIRLKKLERRLNRLEALLQAPSRPPLPL